MKFILYITVLSLVNHTTSHLEDHYDVVSYEVLNAAGDAVAMETAGEHYGGRFPASSPLVAPLSGTPLTLAQPFLVAATVNITRPGCLFALSLPPPAAVPLAVCLVAAGPGVTDVQVTLGGLVVSNPTLGLHPHWPRLLLYVADGRLRLYADGCRDARETELTDSDVIHLPAGTNVYVAHYPAQADGANIREFHGIIQDIKIFPEMDAAKFDVFCKDFSSEDPISEPTDDDNFIEGPKGEKGDKGDSTVGQPGPVGPSGPEGPPGPPGPTGPKGDTGSCSCSGDTVSAVLRGIVAEMKGTGGTNEAARGDKGDQGTAGPVGPSGPVGPNGLAGIQGEKGEKGHQGLKGEKGDKGGDGLQGPRGESGERGGAGRDGAPGTKTEGVKGDKGDKGDRGTPSEVPGEKGSEGDRGAPGTNGSTGKQGPRGPPGQRGPKGSSGKPGIDVKGDKGERGETGPTGSPGSAGNCTVTQFAGVPGPPGPIGPPGPPGVSVRGPKGEPGEPGLSYSSSYELNEVMQKDEADGDDVYTTTTIIVNTVRALLKRGDVATRRLGTLAYVVQERAFLIRHERGWQYLQMGTLIADIDVPSPPTSTVSHEAVHLHATLTLPQDDGLGYTSDEPSPSLVGPSFEPMEPSLDPMGPSLSPSRVDGTNDKPVYVRGKSLRLIALDEPLSGALRWRGGVGLSGAQYACVRSARRERLAGTFVPFLATSTDDLRSLVTGAARALPVVTRSRALLAASWSDLFRAPLQMSAATITSFRGRDVFRDPLWPVKAVWHGAREDGRWAGAARSCGAWRGERGGGRGAPLVAHSLLQQETFECSARLAVLCVETSGSTNRPARAKRRLRNGVRHRHRGHPYPPQR